jgi:uncharacterized membrane protein YraQ (UPF0718 family)
MFETLQVFGGLLVTMAVLFVPITVGIVLLQRWVGPERLRRWLGGRSLVVALLKGTALGAVTPFCGCSTIPLLLGLLRANVRFAAVAAFTLASPLLNPYILAVVGLLFGPSVTVAYAGVAIVSTMVLAALAEAVGLERALKPHDRPSPLRRAPLPPRGPALPLRRSMPRPRSIPEREWRRTSVIPPELGRVGPQPPARRSRTLHRMPPRWGRRRRGVGSERSCVRRGGRRRACCARWPSPS